MIVVIASTGRRLASRQFALTQFATPHPCYRRLRLNGWRIAREVGVSQATVSHIPSSRPCAARCPQLDWIALQKERIKAEGRLFGALRLQYLIVQKMRILSIMCSGSGRCEVCESVATAQEHCPEANAPCQQQVQQSCAALRYGHGVSPHFLRSPSRRLSA